MRNQAAQYAWKPVYTVETVDRNTAPQSEVERFLAANTIYCAAYRARIRREQCGINLKNGLHLCTGCPQGQAAPVPENPKRRPFIRAASAPKQKQADTAKQKQGKTAKPDRRKGSLAEGRPAHNLGPAEMLKLQALLKAHNATQVSLSAHMKMCNPTLSHYMTGVRKPTGKFMAALPGAVAALLNLPVEDVLAHLGRPAC